MIITSGRFRSRKIATELSMNNGRNTLFRPTTARTRLAVISMLISNFGELDGLKALDICCGSGAFGFEMLSLNASHVTFVDIAKKQLELVKYNANLLKIPESRFKLKEGDMIQGSELCAQQTFDIIYLDPPYNIELKGLETYFRYLNQNGILIVECGSKMHKNHDYINSLATANNLNCQKKEYGKTVIFLLKQPHKM